MKDHPRKNSSVKKFMSVFLSLAVMVGVVSASGLTASAADNNSITDTATGLQYTIDNFSKSVAIVGFTAPAGFNGCLIIPDTLGGKTVSRILHLYQDSKVTSVTIPISVSLILPTAFAGYYAKFQEINVDPGNATYSSHDGVLYSKNGEQLLAYPQEKPGAISIPTGVTTIGPDAFAFAKNSTAITIPNSVTSIGDYAFYQNENLPSITIPSSVKTIGEEAFNTCDRLTNITIPSSVTAIGDAAFGSCWGLTQITVDNANKNYSSQDGVLYSKDGKTLLQYPSAKSGALSIPNTVTSIGKYAFMDAINLSNVIIPNSVTVIDDSAFCDSVLSNITIPSSVTSIGKYAFAYCGKLTNVTFTGKITKIDDLTFGYMSDPNNTTANDTITITVPVGTKAYYENLLTSAALNGTKAKVVEGAPAAPAAPATPATSATPATIKDSASGAAIVGVNGTAFGANTTLSITPITDAQKIQKASGFLITAAGKNTALVGMQLEALYQINLIQNGVTIEPNGKVRVTMPLPASLKGLKNLNVVRFNDDGTVTLMNAVSDGTNITFETDHFSTYGIVKTQPAATTPATKNLATGDNSPTMPLAILTFAAASAFVLIVSKKKH